MDLWFTENHTKMLGFLLRSISIYTVRGVNFKGLMFLNPMNLEISHIRRTYDGNRT